MSDRELPVEEFAKLVQSLLGLTVVSPWKGYGSAVFLELGAESTRTAKEPVGSRGAACIVVEWDWRVEDGAAVLFGSSNSRPEIERGIWGLKGAAVQSLSVEGSIPELEVLFSSGQRLRSMVMATGDPEWGIRLPNGQSIYARSGALCLGQGVVALDEHEQFRFGYAEAVAERWGVPVVEPTPGRCRACRCFSPIDGEGHLLDYGVCTSSDSPFDGRAVNVGSGCPEFAEVPDAQG